MEDKVKVEQKEKVLNIIGILNSALGILALPALVFVFSFAYNGGYNSFYGIPVFFTNTSPIAFLRNIPFLSEAIQVIVYSSLIISVLWRLITFLTKNRRDKRGIKKNSSLTNVVILLVSLAVMIYGITSRSILSIIMSAFLLLISTIFLIIDLLNVRIEEKYLPRIQEDIVKADLNKAKENLTKAKNTFVYSSGLLEVLPNFKKWFLILAVVMIGSAFIALYFTGYAQAELQDYYYVTESNKAIISTFESHLIAVNLNWNEEKQAYIFDPIYELLPLENLEFSLVFTGRIVPSREIPQIKMLSSFE